MSLVDMINGAMEATIPAAHKLGIEAVEARPGFAAATVPLEGNGNHFGVVYAGVEFTAAARSDLRAEASLDEDELRRIENEAAENGKADFALNAVVRDEAGQTVAVTRGLYQLRAHGK